MISSARPLRRVAFRVEYDGTAFHGWQRQRGGLRTVQGELQKEVSAAFSEEIVVDGASRTDAGVHARDQLAALSIQHPIQADGLVKALNRRLPDDLAVRDACEVGLDFIPRFAAQGKTYCYRLYTGHDRRPLVDRVAWRVPWRIDPARIDSAAAPLIGTYDFTSFAAKDGGHRSAVRTVEMIAIRAEAHDLIAIHVRGTAFLKQMVRNLVGTLVEAARGRWKAADVERILAARDRGVAGPTAPAKGLTLERVGVDLGTVEPSPRST